MAHRLDISAEATARRTTRCGEAPGPGPTRRCEMRRATTACAATTSAVPSYNPSEDNTNQIGSEDILALVGKIASPRRGGCRVWQTAQIDLMRYTLEKARPFFSRGIFVVHFGAWSHDTGHVGSEWL